MENQMLQTCPVSLTEGAYKEIRRIIENDDVPDGHTLKVAVKGGGCAGFSYVLGFDEKSEKDEVYQFRDLSILMEKSHGLYLAGMEIDYIDGLNNRGFIFNNPNASDTCGCGTSFSA